MEISLDALPEDPAALQAIILAQHQKIVGMAASSRAYEALIQALKLTIARLKRQKYGASSEKIDREIAQLELALEGLEMAGAAADPAPETGEADSIPDAVATEQLLPPRRRGKPRIAADAPREVITLDPGERCPDCGGVLRLVGEDVAEILDFIAAELKVIEVHRPKKSCRDCERMVQTPAPAKARKPLLRSPEETGPAGPGGPADPARSGRAVALGAYPGDEVRRSRCVLNAQPEREVRCCTRDEGGPLGFGDQAPIPNHRELLSLRAMVVSVTEKAGR